ncbi:AraC family transcriptional regulator [Arcticibacter pallidicorallinus]|uniref:AraC family transcriptional regulator n=1 Tax=Arcticibacter pallidicorallinus TaxID=1259464 RepID=A0A2T0U418_9SPHI|nr:helix-turn-helix domain-containing protein [Arcticibacter pallidicorallinus]PRY52665.1 AraC family transcriptional regulator [Arcticibacter pallidicorallinus]
MKNDLSNHRFNSLSRLHKALGMPAPVHPLVSLINNADGTIPLEKLPSPHILSFYKISYKMNFQGKFKYGQHYYDFDEGGMFFVSPNQITGGHVPLSDQSGYTLLFHPDFLLGYELARKIKEYGFFSYSIHEALHLSEKEKDTIIAVFQSIEEELRDRIDNFSQDVVISQIELLLNYANRFYNRQFITRKAVSSDLLQKVEEILQGYFQSTHSQKHGLPTVQFLSAQLNVSGSYLSDMLRSLTGQNAQQHIHSHLIEKAKEQLSTSHASISEIAYELGFEHPQSFTKLFKLKTSVSPLDFRRSFN